MNQNTNLKKRTVSSLLWHSGNLFGKQILSFSFTIILSRILAPTDFGIIAIAMVVLGFPNTILDFGLSSAIIQRKDISDVQESSVFVITMASGILWFIIFFFLSEPISKFYDLALLKTLIKIMSVKFLLLGYYSILRSKIIKDLKFDKLFIIDIIGILVPGLFSVAFALNGFGVWSLVMQHTLAFFTNLLLFSYFYKWIPTFNFSYNAIKPLFNFSFKLTINNVFNFSVKSIDKLLIGMYGPASLGYYNRGFSLSSRLGIIGISFAEVLFSYFSKIQDDHAQIKRAIIKIIKLLSVIVFPFIFCMILESKKLVLLLFGSQWVDSVPYLKIFLFNAIINLLGFFVSTIYLSQGRTDLQLKYGILSKSITMIIILLCSKHGTIFMAQGILVLNILTTLIHMNVSGNLINLKLNELLFIIIKYLSFLMLTAMIFISLINYFSTSISNINNLVYFCLLCISFYSVFYFILFTTKNFPLKDFKSIFELMKIK